MYPFGYGTEEDRLGLEDQARQYETPWLGDIDRRADDDVEFCDEGDWMDES